MVLYGFPLISHSNSRPPPLVRPHPHMRILPNYIARNFITTLIVALLVLNFVMSVGLLFKVMRLFARGMSLGLVWDFIRAGMPGTLSYSIPISILVSSLLVFGRLSTDSEISAMRASGISVWQIMRVPLIISVLLASVCLHINNDISPQGTYILLSMRSKMKITDVSAIIQPGIYTELSGHSVYVGTFATNTVTDLRIKENAGNFVREITARTAYLIQTNDTIILDMRDVMFNPAIEPGSGNATAARVQYPLNSRDDDGRGGAEKERRRRPKDKFTWMLIRDLATARDNPPESAKGVEDLGRVRVSFAIRLVFTLSCVCFAMIGIPLGVKSHRRESSLNMVLCLALTGFFYLVGIFAESLAKRPQYHAHYFVWIPVAVCLIAGIHFARKTN